MNFVKKNILQKFFLSLFLFFASPNYLSGAVVPPNKGHYNDLSSCFLNSSIQALFHIQPLREWLSKGVYDKTTNADGIYLPESVPGRLITALNEMAKNEARLHLNSPSAGTDGCDFRGNVTSNVGGENMNFGQHDAQQFFSFIIDTLQTQTRFHAQLLAELQKPFDSVVFDDRLPTDPHEALKEEVFFKIESDTKFNDLIPNKEAIKAYVKNKVGAVLLETAKMKLWKAIEERNNANFETTLTLLTGMKQFQDHIKKYVIINGLIKAGIITTANFIAATLAIKTIIDGATKLPQPATFATMEAEILEHIKERSEANKAIFIEAFGGFDEAQKFLTHSLQFNKASLTNLLPLTESEWGKISSSLDAFDWEPAEQIVQNIAAVKEKIAELFNAAIISTLSHEANGQKHISKSFDLSFLLSIIVPAQADKIPLVTLLDSFFTHETLTRTDAVYCEKCDARVATDKHLRLGSLPDILSIGLKRFSFGFGMESKITTPVTFPLTNLDVAPYLEIPSPQAINYDLVGIIIHSGSTDGGHYYTYAKWYGDEPAGSKDQWFHYDDISAPAEFTSDATITDIAEQRTESGGPYILIYQMQPESKRYVNEVYYPIIQPLHSLAGRLTHLRAQVAILKDKLTQTAGKLRELKDRLTTLQAAIPAA